MTATPLIRVVDDDESLRTALLRLLDAAGYEAQGYASTGDFLLHSPRERPGCLLLDLRLPGPSGLDLQAALPDNGFTLPVVFMTGHPEVAASVRAMKAGAVDFLEKPVERQDPVRRAGARPRARRQPAPGPHRGRALARAIRHPVAARAGGARTRGRGQAQQADRR